IDAGRMRNRTQVHGCIIVGFPEMVSSGDCMASLMMATLPYLTAVLVFAAGFRMAPPQNAVAGGTGALLLYVLHPTFLSGFRGSSPWDAFFVMLFVFTW